MECKITCFDRVIHLTKKLPQNKLQEAVEIVTEYNFIDFLDFCRECGCYTKSQEDVLYDFIVMWEDLDGTYWEEDYDKLQILYDAVGLTEEVFELYSREEC